MDQAKRDFIIHILDQCQDLALATVRPDGWPQVTTVSFAHDGLTLYVGVGRDSQKAANIRHSDKVSFTVSAPYSDWSQIRGVSAAATARILDKPEEIEHAGACMLRRFPQVAQWAQEARSGAVLMLEIRPTVVSMLDYRKGFGHTELAEV